MAYSAYQSEAELATWLHSRLDMGGFATALGWSVVGGSYDDIVNEALAMVAATDITSLTSVASIRKLNAAGAVALWQQVVDATVHYRAARTPDGSQASMEQIHEHAVKRLRDAKGEAAALGVTLATQQVGVTRVKYSADPYASLYTNGDEFS